jgi:Zn-dependent metalloprotease
VSMCSSAPAHRHSIFCIIPPHMLRQIARNGDARQRELALETLAHDSTNRSNREVANFAEHMTFRRPPVLRSHQANRHVYDVHHQTTLPGTIVRSEGQQPVADTAVNDVYDNLGHTFDFYLQKYGRVSVNNAGMALNATVHYSNGYDNAFWNGGQMVFGDGHVFHDLTKPIDITGHELTHGVTQYESGLAYHDQPGALNESMSDVFGIMIKQFALNLTADQSDWLIGDGVLPFAGQALRSMKAPGTAYDNKLLGKDPQPADMAHYLQTAQDNGGVHLNSGIPNRAFYLAAVAIGGYAWEKAGQVWYDTQRDVALKNMAQTVTFKSFAELTEKNAASRYGDTSPERKAVAGAWSEVGVI